MLLPIFLPQSTGQELLQAPVISYLTAKHPASGQKQLLLFFFWLKSNRNVFLTVLQAGSPRSRHQQIRYLVKVCFLTHRLPSSHCVFTGQKGQGVSYKGTNPILKGSILMT